MPIPRCKLGNLPYFYILCFNILYLCKIFMLISGSGEYFICLKDEIMFWLKSFVVITIKGSNSYVKTERRLGTQTRVKGCPQRYLDCPRACSSQ